MDQVNSADENKLVDIISRLDRIEQSIVTKFDPLLDLLQLVVKNGIKKSYSQSENNESPVIEQPDLMYSSDTENVYISGKKTYDNRDLIKTTFKGSSWNKEKTAWSFKKFEDYEKILIEVFPNIVKDQ